MATRPTSSSSCAQVRLRPPASTTASRSGCSARRRPRAQQVGDVGSIGPVCHMGGYFHSRVPRLRLPPCDAAARQARPRRRTCSSARTLAGRGRRGRRRGRDARSTSRPTRRAAAFFDVDNTVMQGASIFHLARGLHRRKFFTTRDILGAAWKQAYFRVVGVEDPEHVAEARASALTFIAGHTVDRARGARRGDLRRGDGAPDLAGHPRARPAAPRPGPAGLAGDRRPDRDRPDHRPPARPDRRDGHRRRARRRRLHRPAGRRHAARPGQGARRSRRSPPARGST